MDDIGDVIENNELLRLSWPGQHSCGQSSRRWPVTDAGTFRRFGHALSKLVGVG